MPAGNRISVRAKLARLGLRWLVKRRGHKQTLAESRRRFAAMERRIPAPPRSVTTTHINAGGVTGDWIVAPRSRPDRSVLYLHGGGYRVGSPATYRQFTWRIASATRARLLAIDYRLAPEHAFPAALEDAMAAYCWLRERGPGELIVVGDSAGGGLALGLMLKLRDMNAALPAAAVVLSPWTDLALTGATLRLNAEADAMLNAPDLPKFAADYLAGIDPRTPYASPLYGDTAGLPPTLIHVGSDEILRDDAVRMSDNMRQAGCRVELAIWPRMPHVWHLLAPLVPEANAAIAQIGRFVDKVLQSKQGAADVERNPASHVRSPGRVVQ